MTTICGIGFGGQGEQGKYGQLKLFMSLGLVYYCKKSFVHLVLSKTSRTEQGLNILISNTYLTNERPEPIIYKLLYSVLIPVLVQFRPRASDMLAIKHSAPGPINSHIRPHFPRQTHKNISCSAIQTQMPSSH